MPSNGFNPQLLLSFARDNNTEALQQAAALGAPLDWGNSIGQVLTLPALPAPALHPLQR